MGPIEPTGPTVSRPVAILPTLNHCLHENAEGADRVGIDARLVQRAKAESARTI